MTFVEKMFNYDQGGPYAQMVHIPLFGLKLIILRQNNEKIHDFHTEIEEIALAFQGISIISLEIIKIFERWDHYFKSFYISQYDR